MYSFELPMKVAYAVSWSKSPRSTRNETVAFSSAAGGAGMKGHAHPPDDDERQR
jgi:hypothetical protein